MDDGFVRQLAALKWRAEMALVIVEALKEAMADGAETPQARAKMADASQASADAEACLLAFLRASCAGIT